MASIARRAHRSRSGHNFFVGSRMEASNEKFNRATPNRPEGTRTIDAPALRINLPDAIRQIKSEATWNASDRNAITLLHSEYQRVVLVAMKEGAELSRHATDAAQTIQVLGGRIWIETDALSFNLDENEIGSLAPRLMHYIYAEEESVFLMTFAGDGNQEF